jgi:hypothetical protein
LPPTIRSDLSFGFLPRIVPSRVQTLTRLLFGNLNDVAEQTSKHSLIAQDERCPKEPCGAFPA